MNAYRAVSLLMAAAFLATGLAFLAAPAAVLAPFNAWSVPLGLPEAPTAGGGLWHGLAAAYMYVVTLIAAAMARHPEERRLPWLLAHAKLASAVLSAALFLRSRYLVLGANLVVDLALGLLALAMYRWNRA